MTTVVEALTQAAQDIRDAVASVLGLRADMQALKDSTTTSTQAIVNTIVNRPPILNVYCDPGNGSDANDGATINTPKKSVDAIVAAMGSNATQILLLNDCLFRKRTTIYAPLLVAGIQKANNSAGYILFQRQISWLGSAENSPGGDGSSYCAGLFTSAATARFDNTDFLIPDTPAGNSYRSFFDSSIHCSVVVYNSTVRVAVASAAAGFLFGAQNSRLTVSLGYVLGAGAAGHVFSGIAAGANPNSLYNYSSNVTSA